MKFRFKLLTAFAVFIIAFLILSGGIRRSIFPTRAETTVISEATLPTVSIDVNGCEINRLHGYVSNLDEMIIRETITPLSSERTFTVVIDDNGSDVRKLKYEVLNDEHREVESDSFTVLPLEDGSRKVTIRLKETMKSGKEYIVKFTLITNQSKRIYYYTRLKMYDDGHLYEKLDFAVNFHNILLNGTAKEQESLKKYLESSKKSDNSTYAYVNIKSSFEMITWGNLEPEVIWEELPSIVEFYDSMATIELKYLVRVETDNGTENYVVKEHFRFNYTSIRTYLYNYERYMEALFDVKNTSLLKDEFKLGITSDTQAQTGASESRKYLGFVYGRELMVYDVGRNTLNVVFSFRANNEDYSRDLYDQHDVRLLRMHDNGNVDFLVSGYMNRGEYEGRVGIVLYRYIHDGNRIEEQLYIPIGASYQLLAADMTDFSYLSEKDIFYFALYDSIYSYNLTTRQLNVIARDVPEDKMLFCEEENYLAWQDNPNDCEARNIFILNLTDGEIHVISTSPGETIRLMGRINNNLIYCFAYEKDTWILADGSRRLPSYKLCIEDGYGNVLKTYVQSGYYIDDVEIGDNIIVLKRLKRNAGSTVSYSDAEDDSILNRLTETAKPVSVTRRITDRILTEYYISLPSSVDIAEIPTRITAVSTVINYDTTTRVAEPENRALYYAYSFGKVVYSDYDVARVIAEADANVGTVISKSGRVIWERGVKAARTEITGINPVDADGTKSSSMAAVQMLLAYKNLNADVSDYDSRQESVYEYLSRNMKSTVLDLTGATLDEVLYYVYKSRPVIAFRSDGNAIVITGYDATSITAYEPARKKSNKYPIKEAIDMLEKGGNIYVTYVD